MTVVTIHAICKHNKLRALVTSLALQQVKEVKVEGTKDVDYKCECTAQFYIILTLSITMIGLIRSFVCNTKRPSLKQSMKWQVSSKLADKPSLADLPPHSKLPEL